MAATTSKHRREKAVSPRLVRQSDRKSTRLNSSHLVISYAVFCLKKKKKELQRQAGYPDHVDGDRRNSRNQRDDRDDQHRRDNSATPDDARSVAPAAPATLRRHHT